MDSDSFSAHASTFVTVPSSTSKDFAKKKRGNRTAKLKQCKLDARREQWLSQVKKKGGKEESGDGKAGDAVMHSNHQRGRSIEKQEISPRGFEGIDGSTLHFSDSESPSNCPKSHTSSVFGGNDSGTNFTGSSTGGSSSSSSSSGGSCSGSVSDENEEVDDGCLDDWEAVADALAATDEKQEDHDHDILLDSASLQKNTTLLKSHQVEANQPMSPVVVSKCNPKNGAPVQRAPVTCRAWRPDDAYRPQSLPTLSKQFSFPMDSERRYGCGGVVWGSKNAISPTSCPICYEDLDFTDSSFFPCPCGFRLCLFCHKRILEEDGRCPGCRKHYHCDLKTKAPHDGSNLTIKLARSFTSISRP